MDGFVATGAAYRSDRAAAVVPLQKVEPPHRLSDVPKDWRGFDRTRLVQALAGTRDAVFRAAAWDQRRNCWVDLRGAEIDRSFALKAWGPE
jgi:hypothetical protein